jgi:hypothetical protein
MFDLIRDAGQLLDGMQAWFIAQPTILRLVVGAGALAALWVLWILLRVLWVASFAGAGHLHVTRGPSAKCLPSAPGWRGTAEQDLGAEPAGASPRWLGAFAAEAAATRPARVNLFPVPMPMTGFTNSAALVRTRFGAPCSGLPGTVARRDPPASGCP